MSHLTHIIQIDTKATSAVLPTLKAPFLSRSITILIMNVNTYQYLPIAKNVSSILQVTNEMVSTFEQIFSLCVRNHLHIHVKNCK